MNPVIKNTMIVVGTAAAFLALYNLNSYLFSNFEFSHRANWIFLPSGLRLLLVLLFVEYGAIGIALGTFMVDVTSPVKQDEVTLWVSALIHGGSPLLSRWICIKTFDLDVHMRNLSAATLLKMTLIFATVSPILHQSWYNFRGYSVAFVSGTLVMAVGDVLGVLIVLYCAMLCIKLFDLVKK